MSTDGSRRGQNVASMLPLLVAQRSRFQTQSRHDETAEHCDQTSRAIQNEATAMVELLVKGQLDEIVMRCVFPVAVYVGKKVMILNDKPSFLRALTLYRSILVDAGLGHIESKLTKNETALSGKSLISVEKTVSREHRRQTRRREDQLLL